ncbi:MAG TPA: type 4 pilus major pilin [Coxiellaceae bacterium]|nr:type 4 pilus major pilin [Coxiellaceae bacterium]
MKKNILGFSLIELLFVTAVAAGILLLGARYFNLSRSNLKVTNSIAQIQKITSASYQWLNGQSQLDFSGANASNGTAINLTALINTNYLTNTPNDTRDAWGGVISISADPTNPRYVRINLPAVPKTACNNLKQHLANTAQSQITNCTSSSGYHGSF